MFARQLQSIQAQTHTQFVCLISVDGNPEPVRAMVRRACGQDDRFRVLGYENRLGFHHNFERALKEVPAEARWVALSDQDDYWYSEKLSTLLPQLDETALVTGQARVVSPEISATDRDPTKGNLTDRRSVGAADLIANNQVTGSLCVFRREVLNLALPFPSMPTPAQYHDHWIGICALAVGGVKVQNLVLQDYIQHGGNVVGESRQRLLSSIRNTFRFVRRYEGNASPRSICRIIYKTGLGWRQLMAQTLRDRLALRGIPPLDGLEHALAVYSRPHCAALIRLLIRGMRGGNVPPMRVLEILMGAALRRWGS
ncbi:glycosyltransferase [Pseudarthrobacter sp. NamE2]|nr:glycosyltransferase [Pseudarthrobacter sp. NamE2]